MQLLSEQQKIGAFLLVFSAFFSFLGVLLFFDGGLLSVGNLCMLPGIALVLGVRRLLSWMTQVKKLPGFVAFLGGVGMVLYGLTYLGFFVELFGFINLFGNFYPAAWRFVKGTLLWGWSFSSFGKSN